jgi:hypothetical protein
MCWQVTDIGHTGPEPILSNETEWSGYPKYFLASGAPGAGIKANLII